MLGTDVSWHRCDRLALRTRQGFEGVRATCLDAHRDVMRVRSHEYARDCSTIESLERDGGERVGDAEVAEMQSAMAMWQAQATGAQEVGPPNSGARYCVTQVFAHAFCNAPPDSFKKVYVVEKPQTLSVSIVD